VAKNNKTRFFCVLYSDKTWGFDQSERAQCPIYNINENKNTIPFSAFNLCSSNLLKKKGELLKRVKEYSQFSRPKPK